MTFDPQNMASRLTSDYFDSDFCVPLSICNQKLPDKLSWYEFDVFTGRSFTRSLTYTILIGISRRILSFSAVTLPPLQLHRHRYSDRKNALLRSRVPFTAPSLGLADQ